MPENVTLIYRMHFSTKYSSWDSADWNISVFSAKQFIYIPKIIGQNKDIWLDFVDSICVIAKNSCQWSAPNLVQLFDRKCRWHEEVLIPKSITATCLKKNMMKYSSLRPLNTQCFNCGNEDIDLWVLSAQLQRNFDQNFEEDSSKLAVSSRDVQ